MQIKGLISFVLALVASMVFAGTTLAGPVELFVDSAPNVYGSPDWSPWWSNAKQDVVNGTFTNMRNGTYPGTNNVNPNDFIVYSDEDLGKRVHWIYFIEGETTASITDRFQVKYALDWDGVEYTYDNGWLHDSPDAGWLTPGTWEDYDDGNRKGVIGSFGWAFWATLGKSGSGDLAQDILDYQTYLRGAVRYREDINSDWNMTDINLTVIPLPSTLLMALAGLGVVGIFGWRRMTIG